jgi:glyoxylase-like metal-dependent hydrolase (beta-lactamase superfamily II)
MHIRWILPLAICLGVVGAISAQDFSKVQVKATKVAGNVYMLEGSGGNIGASVGEDGIVLIDDQFAPLAPKIEAALKQITDKPVKFVVNTHWHGDHTGGNPHFGATATIVAHTNVRSRLATESVGRNGEKRPAAPKVALPILTFDDRVTLHLNGEDIRVIHVPPGHTDGDSVIYFTQSNVVHMGDDLFSGRFPFIDLRSGGSVKGLIAGVDKVLSEMPANVKIIPGHGPLSSVEELKAFSQMLKETSAIVEAEIKAGKSLDQMKNEKVLKKYDKWSWEFIKTDQFLETLYNDSKKK